jgi:pimeloyl-ACP methyl ester carboxylesterase
VTGVIFLPGIIAPPAIRYAPLLAELDDVDAVLKDLEVYSGETTPPPGYSIETEVAGISRAADSAGFERFHLYGHSGGGAMALAYAVTHPQRVLSLAVDEPAFDFTDEGNAAYGSPEFAQALSLPPAEATGKFLRLQVADDVELSPPAGPPPPWMANRPAGIRAAIDTARRHHVDPDAYRAFDRPVYFSRGSRTHPRWAGMQERMAGWFPDFTGEVYEGLHHLNTSHQAEPARVARTLRAFWARAEA